MVFVNCQWFINCITRRWDISLIPFFLWLKESLTLLSHYICSYLGLVLNWRCSFLPLLLSYIISALNASFLLPPLLPHVLLTPILFCVYNKYICILSKLFAEITIALFYWQGWTYRYVVCIAKITVSNSDLVILLSMHFYFNQS